MRALFDISFTRFIAPSIARIVYLLVMVVIMISYFAFVILSFQQNAFLGVLVLLVIGPIFSLLYLVLARVGLEALIASIRTAENTGELVRRGNAGVGPVVPPSYPPYRPDTKG